MELTDGERETLTRWARRAKSSQALATRSRIVLAITAITEDEVRIGQTRENVAGAPACDPELVRERDTYGGVLGYYGFGPFWGSDYRYPDYPYYR